MILARQDDRLRVVTQNDHACLASELLSLWRREELPEHPRRRELLFAAREHDNGWREADSAPRADAESGDPLDFIAVSQELRREIWRRGIGRFREQEPWAALLILQHAIHLHRDHVDDGDWAPLIAQWHRERDDVLDDNDWQRSDLDQDYRWIELTDLLSLGLCSDWQRTRECHGYHVELRPGVLSLDPFPLAGATTFRVPCRYLPVRPYASDTDLGVELAIARWTELEVRVAPR